MRNFTPLRLLLLLILGIISGCSWLLPRFFPENVQELPPRPLKEYFCPNESAQIIGPNADINLAIADFWKKNPHLTIAQIFRLLILSSSQHSPHLLGPDSQQETLFLPNKISSTIKLEPISSKLNASTARELLNGPDFKIPYSELELNFLAQLQKSMVVSDSLEKFLLIKLKLAQRKNDQTYFHKKNGHLLNQGDPLPTFPLMKKWGPLPTLNANKVLLNLDKPTWQELSSNSPAGTQCFYHQMPPYLKKNLIVPPFPKEVLFLAVIAKNGEAMIGLFGQDATTMKIVDSKFPYWNGHPTSLGFWCHLQQQIVIGHGRPEIGQWAMEHLPHEFMSTIDANQFQEGARVIRASAPSRLLVESEKLSEDQLLQTLSQKLPPFYEKNLGNINILVPTKNAYSLSIDPRMTEELTCF